MTFLINKFLQIRRDLVESFPPHILKVSGSKSEVQNFSSKGSDKSEKSMRTMQIIDFLPGKHCQMKQNGQSKINYVAHFFNNQPIRLIE